MTIGKNSRKSLVRSSIRAPKFLDKSGGFYGRLDEPENFGEADLRWDGTEDGSRDGVVMRGLNLSAVDVPGPDEKEEGEGFDSNDGVTGDDGETLLCRKPSRRSSRWRRSSRRKHKEGKAEEDAARDERPSLDMESHVLEDTRATTEAGTEKPKTTEGDKEKAGRGTGPALVHFPVREEADDQVLIREKKRGREEGAEERRMKREQEEGMKAVKRSTVKNYRKALDRAFHRGWEAFITNLYSVTLTPVTSSSSPSPSSSASPPKRKQQHNLVLAECL